MIVKLMNDLSRFRQFPPKKRFLTEDEYFDQSRLQTRKALDDLRQFSKSPNCNAWRTMSRLKDPLRYQFIESLLIILFHS